MWPKYLSHVEISIACLPSAPPTGEGVNLSVDIHFLAQGLEKNDILFVGKEVQQPKQFHVNDCGNGDYRREEGGEGDMR